MVDASSAVILDSRNSGIAEAGTGPRRLFFPFGLDLGLGVVRVSFDSVGGVLVVAVIVSLVVSLCAGVTVSGGVRVMVTVGCSV